MQKQDELAKQRARLRHSPTKILATLAGDPVSILDISLTGLGLETRQELDRDAEVTLDLYTEVGELRLVGRVASMRAEPGAPNGNGTQRRFGIHFSPLPRDQAELLHRLLESQKRDAELAAPPREEFTTEFRSADVQRLAEQSRGKQ